MQKRSSYSSHMLSPRFGALLPRFGVLLCSVVLAASALGQISYPAGTSDGTAQPSPAIPAARNVPASSQTSASTLTQPAGQTSSQSKEGFWGHMNPFARKKWVNRQVEPLRERTNELDQVTAKNANDIRDVDSRSQARINHALNAADIADQHAADARSRADAAQGLAADASSRTDALNGTVSGLDQYQKIASVPVRFVAGRTTLGPRAKAQLDDLAAKIVDEKGYLIDVQGYSPAGVQRSEAMADAVTRYLVTQHQVPLYRIYRAGLGPNTRRPSSGTPAILNGVQVSLMHNSLSNMSASSAYTAPSVSPGARTRPQLPQ